LTPETLIMDLLAWAKTHGFEPKTPRQDDHYLEPFTGRIFHWRDLKPHQRPRAYWIPTQRGLKDLGLRTRKTTHQDFTILEGKFLVGAGEGEREAALSILNQMRTVLAH